MLKISLLSLYQKTLYIKVNTVPSLSDWHRQREGEETYKQASQGPDQKIDTQASDVNHTKQAQIVDY